MPILTKKKQRGHAADSCFLLKINVTELIDGARPLTLLLKRYHLLRKDQLIHS
jgi:hypothetical protein